LVKISVIIPTYNRPVSLEKCLDALVNQTVDSSAWEVVVVNDGGEPLDSLLTKYQNRINCKSINQENCGPASARNAGVERAAGQIIALLDDDCLPERNWIQQIINHAKPGTIIGGKVNNFYNENLFSEASQVLIDFLYAFNEGRKDAFFTSNNFCLFREDFVRLKGFSTAFQTSAGEDREFCVRAENQGVKLIFNPEMKIRHAHKLSFISFCQLHKKYGFAAFDYQKSLQKQGVKFNSSPRLAFYFKMLKFPFKQAEYNFYQKAVLAFLLGISQFFVAVGFFQNKLLAN